MVDGLLAPSYEDRDIELGSDSISPEHVAFPLWVKCVNAMNVHCDAVECELRRIAALQRQQLLVTFNVSQVEKVEQELKDATAIVHKRLRAAEAQLSAPHSGSDIRFDVPCESNAAQSSRLNASQYLAKRLQELSGKYHTARQDSMAHTLQHWELEKRRKVKNDKVAQSPLSQWQQLPWKNIDNELAFLTKSIEHRVIEHLDTRRPGELVMSLEQISQLDEEETLTAIRDGDLNVITKSVTEVAHIFKELAVLVIDQGTVLDRIDYNMEHVAERTQIGTKHLAQTSRSQVNARPLKCAIALLIIIAVHLFFLIHKFA